MTEISVCNNERHSKFQIWRTLTPTELKKYGENPKSPTSPHVEASPALRREHDPEEDHIHHQKKSVLTKVKERAKKLRRSLSGKKKHSEGGNTTPSWGVRLEDEEEEEEEDEDVEYLGAPSILTKSL